MENKKVDNTSATDKEESLIQTLKDAYIYGLPLVLMDITKRQMTNPMAGASYAPLNQFRHNSFFPDASFRNVVRPNADTYYSIAWLDLSQEPIVLSVPNTDERYYMLPMLDAYSNVFASPGTRTTGNHPAIFLISGPHWKGQVPNGMKQIQAPTNTVWIIGRTQVNSKEDGAKNVVPLQRQYQLTPLHAEGKTSLPSKAASDPSSPTGDPNTIVRQMPVEEYFNYVNQILANNPPPPEDKAALDRFSAVGIGVGKKFDLGSLSAATVSAVKNIPEDVFSAFSQEKDSTKELINGWNLGRNVIGTYGTDYYSRASTAFFGLGANLREDAIYPNCYVDADGQALSGANNYVMHFEKGQTPPVHAFWSLTLYNPDGYFVTNPLNRYTLGDRSHLKTNADGSIDIYIQKDDPGMGKTSNWLPAPGETFNLLLRLYWPKPEILNQKWHPPAVRKII